MRNGNQLDYSDLYERFVDLWQEARLAIWRAKHNKAGIKQWDDDAQQYVVTFAADEKLVLQAIDTTAEFWIRSPSCAARWARKIPASRVGPSTVSSGRCATIPKR